MRVTVVDALAIYQPPGQPVYGGVTRTTLHADANPERRVSVGVFEGVAGDTGDQWRASVWMSAILASLLSGEDMRDVRFSIQADGAIEGPSAGALVTVGFLAALRGDPIDPLATMTGTINPDGTVGPVEGIPQKFEGAIAKGKKRLGFPVGLGTQKDVNTGKLVDLAALARSKGAEAVEVEDVYGAYRLLTGRDLPRTTPVDAARMAVPDDVEATLRAKGTAWLADARTMLAQGKAALGDDPAVAQATAWIDAAAAAFDADAGPGRSAPAYWRAIGTVLAAGDLLSDAEVERYRKAADFAKAAASHTSAMSMADGLLSGLFAKLKTVTADNVTNLMTLVDAFEAGVAAHGYFLAATRALAATQELKARHATLPATALPSDRDALVKAIFDNVRNVRRTTNGIAANVRVGLDNLDFMRAGLPAMDAGHDKVDSLTGVLDRASAASLKLFEVTVLPNDARANKVGVEQVKAFLMATDDRYRGAAENRLLYLHEKPLLGETGLPIVLAHLAGAFSSYFRAVNLVTRFYALGVKEDKETRAVQSIAQAKAFGSMLRLAEEAARSHAAEAARVLGLVPIPACIAYQIGADFQKGESLDGKLHALEQFWRSSIFSQLAVMLAR